MGRINREEYNGQVNTDTGKQYSTTEAQKPNPKGEQPKSASFKQHPKQSSFTPNGQKN